MAEPLAAEQEPECAACGSFDRVQRVHAQHVQAHHSMTPLDAQQEGMAAHLTEASLSGCTRSKCSFGTPWQPAFCCNSLPCITPLLCPENSLDAIQLVGVDAQHVQVGGVQAGEQALNPAAETRQGSQLKGACGRAGRWGRPGKRRSAQLQRTSVKDGVRGVFRATSAGWRRGKREALHPAAKNNRHWSKWDKRTIRC